jgi:uncharacterized protein YeaO (DUF488 family)
MGIRTKRVYDKNAKNDGLRILVDRVWPRGIRKDKAELDDWLKDVAPSTELRKWFGHDPEKWSQFKQKYFKELEKKKDLVDRIADQAGQHTVTLLYAAKDRDHNNAVALKDYLDGLR